MFAWAVYDSIKYLTMVSSKENNFSSLFFQWQLNWSKLTKHPWPLVLEWIKSHSITCCCRFSSYVWENGSWQLGKWVKVMRGQDGLISILIIQQLPHWSCSTQVLGRELDFGLCMWGTLNAKSLDQTRNTENNCVHRHIRLFFHDNNAAGILNITEASGFQRCLILPSSTRSTPECVWSV